MICDIKNINIYKGFVTLGSCITSYQYLHAFCHLGSRTPPYLHAFSHFDVTKPQYLLAFGLPMLCDIKNIHIYKGFVTLGSCITNYKYLHAFCHLGSRTPPYLHAFSHLDVTKPQYLHALRHPYVMGHQTHTYLQGLSPPQR